jgi:hypothetical protein
LGDDAAVLDQLRTAHRALAVGAAKRIGHAEAGGGERLEAQRLQELGGARIPRVGQDQDARLAMPLAE